MERRQFGVHDTGMGRADAVRQSFVNLSVPFLSSSPTEARSRRRARSDHRRHGSTRVGHRDALKVLGVKSVSEKALMPS